MIQDNILTLSFVNQRIIHIKKNKKKHIDLQSQVICLPKQSYKKKTTYSRRQHKWCASGGIKQVNNETTNMENNQVQNN